MLLMGVSGSVVIGEVISWFGLYRVIYGWGGLWIKLMGILGGIMSPNIDKGVLGTYFILVFGYLLRAEISG